MKRLWICVLILSVFVVGVARGVQAAGVVGSGTAGSCTEAALEAALAGGGTVTFDCGGAHTITVTSQKTINATTTIDGGGLITLSGGDSTRVVFVPHSQGVTLTLENITIANGATADEGGGLLVERGNTAVLTHTTFRNNSAGNGGGVAVTGWGSGDVGVTLTVNSSTFSGNVATNPGIYNGGDGGGGIYASGGSTVTVVDSTFSNNRAANGGGIHMLGANLSVSGSAFAGNVAENSVGGGGGGALYVDGTKNFSGLIAVSLSTFSGNQTNQLGGALFTFPEGNGRVEISDSLFDGNYNVGRGQGGALYHQSATKNGPLTIKRSAFVNNYAHATDGSASQGGALWLLDAPVTITDSTFAHNDATTPIAMAPDNWRRGFGGALVAHAATELVNVTIAHNTAGFVGGGIAGDGATLRNSIVAHNSGGNPWDIQQNCTNELANLGRNLQFPQKTTGNWNDYECLAGVTAVDPQLLPLGDYGGPTPTLALADGSPAVDAASNCSAMDQRGYGRVAPCDIGAYELGAGLVVNSISPPWAEVGAGDLVLLVDGAGFGPNAVVRWGGSDLATTRVSSYVVTAVVPAANLATLGSTPITVYDPDLNMTSDALNFTVVPFLAETYLPIILR